MNLSIHSPALLRGLVAGAAVLSVLSACSRSDRAGTGSDTTQSATATVSPTDTGISTATPPSTATASQPSGDSAITPASDTAAKAQTETAAPRTARNEPVQDTSAATGESVSGYRAMESDTAPPSNPSAADNAPDRAIATGGSVSTSTADTASAEMAGAAGVTDSASAAGDQALTADTATAGYSEMARDTAAAAGTGDTATVAVTDSGVATESDTAGNIPVQLDTATTEQAQADTSSVVVSDTVTVATNDLVTTDSAQGDVAVRSESPDSTDANAGRIRPPEDSTETMGNVTTDSGAVANNDVASQSDSTRIRSPEDSTELYGNVTSDEDRGAVSSSETENAAVGAAAIGSTVTGPEAVALMNRAGERCVVLNEESTEAAWDISDSPANLNPCGPGTMTLSPVRTGEKP